MLRRSVAYTRVEAEYEKVSQAHPVGRKVADKLGDRFLDMVDEILQDHDFGETTVAYCHRHRLCATLHCIISIWICSTGTVVHSVCVCCGCG